MAVGLSLLPIRNRDRSVKRMLKQEQKLPDDLKLKPSKALLAEQVDPSRVSFPEIKFPPMGKVGDELDGRKVTTLKS